MCVVDAVPTDTIPSKSTDSRLFDLYLAMIGKKMGFNESLP